jgi:hypothetical protein
VFHRRSERPEDSSNWVEGIRFTYEYVIGGTVGVSEILTQIDREIAHLQQARALLGGGLAAATRKPAAVARKTSKKKRNLTPEGRRRIAEAVKRRWAEQKKAAAK